MRVVHIFPHLMPGGAERLLVHIMMHLDRKKYEVSGICLASRKGTELEQMLDQAGIPVQFLGKGLGFDPRTYRWVHRAIDKARPDILHSHVHVLRYVLPYIWYSRLMKGRPSMIHTVHSLAEFEVEPRARFVQRFAFNSGVIPVAVAREVAESLCRLYSIESPAVIPNCLPVQRYRTANTNRERWRKQEGFSPDDLLLTCVAGLRPEKNHGLLLHAFAEPRVLKHNVHLVLAGGGDQTRLRELAAKLNISLQVHFLGVRTDIPELLLASDVFVIASKYEGNPLCVMEAMAAGLPVVAPRIGGIPELATSGVEGFLVSPMQPGELACSLDLLLRDESLRKRMGAAGVSRALQCFDIPHMIRAYQDLYDSCVRRPSGLRRQPRSAARENIRAKV